MSKEIVEPIVAETTDIDESTLHNERKGGRGWRFAAAAGAIGGLLLAGVWGASGGLDNYCENRDRVAPGGQASPAEPCERNDDFRAAIGDLFERMGDALTPEIRPLFDLDEHRE